MFCINFSSFSVICLQILWSGLRKETRERFCSQSSSNDYSAIFSFGLCAPLLSRFPSSFTSSSFQMIFVIGVEICPIAANTRPPTQVNKYQPGATALQLLVPPYASRRTQIARLCQINIAANKQLANQFRFK